MPWPRRTEVFFWLAHRLKRFGDKSDDSKGGNDVWVVKVDENEVKLDKTYGGTGLDGAPDGSWENRLSSQTQMIAVI